MATAPDRLLAKRKSDRHDWVRTLKEKPPLENRNLSQQAYDLLRRDILKGIYMPEMKLQIEAVSERYLIGTVPVREALNQLTAEGLVERIKQRGFFVTRLEIGDLQQLVGTRIWAEKKALKDSIERGNDEWEDELVLSFHRLARVSRNMSAGPADQHLDEWDVRHKEFHMQLIAQCGSRWILEFCSSMMDQAVRYRNISMNISSTSARREGAADEHKNILDAVLNKDVGLACQLLEQHYLTTLKALNSNC
jgi:DNA-binding GntR family transcriptional regulator